MNVFCFFTFHDTIASALSQLMNYTFLNTIVWNSSRVRSWSVSCQEVSRRSHIQYDVSFTGWLIYWFLDLFMCFIETNHHSQVLFWYSTGAECYCFLILAAWLLYFARLVIYSEITCHNYGGKRLFADCKKIFPGPAGDCLQCWDAPNSSVLEDSYFGIFSCSYLGDGVVITIC